MQLARPFTSGSRRQVLVVGAGGFATGRTDNGTLALSCASWNGASAPKQCLERARLRYGVGVQKPEVLEVVEPCGVEADVATARRAEAAS